MKKLLFILTMLASMGAQAQKMEFETMEINYGDITKGANGVREFRFKNTGDAPLIIANAVGSCGCLVPDYPREPVMPGATAVIRVKYDTNRTGQFTKYVTLTTNARDNTSPRLTVRGNVMPEPNPIPNGKEKLQLK
jgi:hypothetical protein